MSKYINREDALTAFAEACKGKVLKVLSDHQIIKAFRDNINNLPTIEVSEDAISRGNLISDLAGIWDTYTPNNMTDFQDMLEDIDYKIRNAPLVIPQVPSEDCISREWLLKYTHAEDVGTPDEMWKPASEWVNAIKNAPSIVPSGTIVECYARNCEKNKNGKCEEDNIILEFGCGC